MEQLFQLFGREYRRRASAKINRIDVAFELAFDPARDRVRRYDLATDLPDITIEGRSRKDAGSEIAEAAFRAAEGHRNVNT
jgi:hypothetical protein